MLDFGRVDSLKSIIQSVAIDDKMNAEVWMQRQWSTRLRGVQSKLKKLLSDYSDNQPASKLLPPHQYENIGQRLEVVFSERLKNYWRANKLSVIKQMWLQARAGIGTDFAEAYSLFLNGDVSAVDAVFPFSEDDVWTQWFSEYRDQFHERINQIRDEWIIGFSTINDIIALQRELLEVQPAVLNDGLSYISSELTNVIILLRLIAFPDCECDSQMPASLAYSDQQMYGLEDSSIFIKVNTNDPQTPEHKLVISTGDDLENSIYSFFCEKFFTTAQRQNADQPFRVKQRLAPIMLGIHSLFGMPKIVEMLNKSFPSLSALSELTDGECLVLSPDYCWRPSNLMATEEVSSLIRISDLFCRWLLPIAFPDKFNQKNQSVGDISCELPEPLLNKVYCCPSEAHEVLRVIAAKLNEFAHPSNHRSSLNAHCPRYLSWIRDRLRALNRLGICVQRERALSGEYVIKNLTSWYQDFGPYELSIRWWLMLCCGMILWLPVYVVIVVWFLVAGISIAVRFSERHDDAQSVASPGDQGRPQGSSLKCASVRELPDAPDLESFSVPLERFDTTLPNFSGSVQRYDSDLDANRGFSTSHG